MRRTVIAALGAAERLAVITAISAQCVHPEPPVVIPSPGPLQLSAVVEGPAAVRLSWTDNVPSNIIGIAPVRSATAGPGTFRNLMPGELPATAREYVDDSAAPNASYHYRLRWHHSDDTFSVSPIVSLTVPPVSSEPPRTTSPPSTTVGQVGEPGDTAPDRPAQGQWPDNEPEGLTTLTHVRGNTLDWPGWNKVGRGWPSDAFPTRLFVVSDPESKYGTAIEKRYFEGDISGWGWTKEHQNVGPRWELPRSDHNEIYVRFVFKYSPNWDHHSGGEKLFMHGATTYVIGGVPHPTATFPTFPRGKATSGGYSWLPIIPSKPPPSGLGATRGRQQGYFPSVSRGEYHTVEVWKRKNDPGQVNGAMRWWFDGVEYTRFYKLRGPKEWYDVTFDSVAWNDWGGAHLELPMYWGGQNDTKKVNDWIRMSEIYVSGK